MGFFGKLFSSSCPSASQEEIEKREAEQKKALEEGLQKSKSSFFDKIKRFVAAKDEIDDDTLDELEMALISSDVGIDTTLKIIDRIKERVKRDKYLGSDELGRILREEVSALLA